MRKKKHLVTPLAVACVLLLAAFGVASALRSGPNETVSNAESSRLRSGNASLLHFSLEEMVDRADKVFRGTVVDVSTGTVAVGGGELPIVIYKLRVEEAFKGSFQSKGDVQYVELRMAGNLKEAPEQGDLYKFSVLPDPPNLQMGRDYLLLTTAPSAIGLSTTVGLGQGSFGVYSFDKQEWAKNEFDNAGLYDGAVLYEELTGDIEQLVWE